MACCELSPCTVCEVSVVAVGADSETHLNIAASCQNFAGNMNIHQPKGVSMKKELVEFIRAKYSLGADCDEAAIQAHLEKIGTTVEAMQSEMDSRKSDDPVKEIIAARRILRAVGLDDNFADVISCPTCGRCMWDSMGLAKKIAARLEHVRRPLKVAVMGCVVNGPGEAGDCDIGIAGSRDSCVIFKNGKIFRQIPADRAEEIFTAEIEKLLTD